MHPVITDIYNFVLNTILPVRCVVCTKEWKEPICTNCLARMDLVEQQRCIVCTKPSPFGLTHVPCKNTLTPDRTLCLMQYKSPGCSESIIAGKYNFIPSVFKVYGALIAHHFEGELSILNREHVVVTSLPLHTRRKRWRGYNQSEILAKTLADTLALTYGDILVRTRPTKTQKDLKKDKRIANVKGCFMVQPGLDLGGKVVLLIDDVTTTGSTLLEAAKALKQSHALSVWCIALAQD